MSKLSYSHEKLNTISKDRSDPISNTSRQEKLTADRLLILQSEKAYKIVHDDKRIERSYIRNS